jgi:hypothetical protein
MQLSRRFGSCSWPSQAGQLACAQRTSGAKGHKCRVVYPLCSHNAACAEKRLDAVQSRHLPQDLLCRMIRDRQETERSTARDDLSSLRLRLESGSEVCFHFRASASSACVCVCTRVCMKGVSVVVGDLKQIQACQKRCGCLNLS